MVTLLSGCLTEKNESYTTIDNYFTNVTQIVTGINGCYNPLRSIMGRRDFWEMTDVACDLIYLSSKNVYNANCDVSPARPGVAVPIWRYGYEGVKNTAVQDEFRACNAYAREECRDCWARLYCSGGCAANSYHATGSISGVYSYGCDLFKKRIECAVMMQVAKELDEAESGVSSPDYISRDNCDGEGCSDCNG